MSNEHKDWLAEEEADNQIAENSGFHEWYRQWSQALGPGWNTEKAARDAWVHQQYRIVALETRLEIDPRHKIDGIAARDATISELEKQIAAMEARANKIATAMNRAGSMIQLAKQTDGQWWTPGNPEKVPVQLNRTNIFHPQDVANYITGKPSHVETFLEDQEP